MMETMSNSQDKLWKNRLLILIFSKHCWLMLTFPFHCLTLLVLLYRLGINFSHCWWYSLGRLCELWCVGICGYEPSCLQHNHALPVPSLLPVLLTNEDAMKASKPLDLPFLLHRPDPQAKAKTEPSSGKQLLAWHLIAEMRKVTNTEGYYQELGLLM